MRAAQDPELWETPLGGLPRSKTTSGYVNVRLRLGIWEAEHRMVLAQMLQRPLSENESVHHKNGDRSDNRPENLELWLGGTRNGTRATESVRCPHCGYKLQLTAT